MAEAFDIAVRIFVLAVVVISVLAMAYDTGYRAGVRDGHAGKKPWEA